MSAVVFVKNAPNRIRGLAIPFGGPLAGKDFDGEHFDAETDLCLPWFGETGRPTLYGHGLNPATKADVVGRQVSLDLEDDGRWIEVELDKRSRYHDRINTLVEQGALSFSSGAMPHLVQTTKEGRIARWPWVETSLTPTPANPFAAVYAVKSSDLIDHLAAADIIVPDPLAAALKALDEWAISRDAGSGSELAYADHLARVLGDVEALTSRSIDREAWRAKAGRSLSEANRKRLADLREQANAVIADLDALLTTNDPEATKRAGMAELARFEYLAASIR